MAARTNPHPPAWSDAFVLAAPFLICAYPSIYGLQSYPTLVHPRMVSHALATLLPATALLILLSRPVARSWIGAAATVGVLYAGGIVYLAGRRELWAFAVVPGASAGFWIACGSCTLIVARGAAYEHQRHCGFVLGTIGFTLIVEAAVPLLGHAARPWLPVADRIRSRPISARTRPADEPDVYYIVLDAYGRADVLARQYGFDNSDFLRALRLRGFYVAEDARANYIQTGLSLASSLNMTYLDEIASGREGDPDRAPLRYLIRNNAVSRVFHDAGYEVVLMGSDYPSTMSMDAADRCECEVPTPSFLDLLVLRGRFRAPAWIEASGYRAHAKHVLQTLSDLAAQGRAPHVHPQFVVAHVLSPHPPFVFTRDGGVHFPLRAYGIEDGSHYPGPKHEYRSGYREQVAFLNGRVLETIDSILRNSRTRPVIILQGDHGPAVDLNWNLYTPQPASDRAGILSAFYVGPAMRHRLYPGISPVNSFRLVVNDLFGGHESMLPDVSYYSSWLEPLNFELIPATGADNLLAPAPH